MTLVLNFLLFANVDRAVNKYISTSRDYYIYYTFAKPSIVLANPCSVIHPLVQLTAGAVTPVYEEPVFSKFVTDSIASHSAAATLILTYHGKRMQLILYLYTRV